jgi:two-component system phosphate regulon sensor histidine kinase PhoR
VASLRLRLAVVLGIFALAVGGLGVWLAGAGSAARAAELQARSATARARLVAELVRDTPLTPQAGDALSELVERLARSGDRIALIAVDGTLLADSALRPEDLASASGADALPEVRSALAGRLATRVEAGSAGVPGRLHVAVPAGVEPRGAVRLSLDLDPAAGSAGGAAWLATAAAALLAAAALAALLAGALGRRLGEIQGALRASGPLAPRAAASDARDPFAEIAVAVRSLGNQLDERLQEVVREKEMLQAVLGGMVEGVLVVDREGRIALANRELRELFALHGEVEGRQVLEVIRSAAVHEALEVARRTGEPVRREISFEAPQRRVFEIRAARVPAVGENGALAVFHDVTEMRRLEAVRRDFVANASHELRTPLTAIRGFAETLVASDVPAPERGRYLRIILDHSERIESLVDDLLDLSRLERESVALELEELELEPVVRGVMENLSQVFAERQLAARCGDLAVPAVFADQRAVEQILYNLLDNAAKYTEPGGRIEVRAEARGAFVRLSVADTGIGIPEADRARIFERFYRVEKARSRDLGGTGLGLSIVKHLVHAQAGEVFVASRESGGTTFTVRLPSAPLAG